MPRLIYRGNTTNNFGKFLPAPYVEKVVIGTRELELTTSTFVNSPTNEIASIGSVLNHEVYQYVVFLADYEGSDDSIEELLSRSENIFTTIQRSIEGTLEAGDNPSSSPWGKYFNSTSFGDPAFYTAMFVMEHYWDTFVDTSGPYCYVDFASPTPFDIESDADGTPTNLDIVFDEEGTRYIKIIKESSLEHPPFANLDTSGLFPYCDNVFLFTFTSAAVINWETIGDLTDQEKNILLKEISDVSYEKIIEDGEPVSQTENIWVDKNNFPYDDTPLQSITSDFYKSEKITHQDIVDTFNDLLAEYEEAVEVDSKLKKAVDNIAYVLSVYAEKPQLMPQLNLLRKTFESKSTVDGVGKLYVRFRGAIFNVNKAIIKEDRLFKQLIINPKIIDGRDLPIVDSWSQLHDGHTFEDYEIVYDHWYMGSEVITYQRTPDNEVEEETSIFSHGFFFFDYEKLRNFCNATQIFELSKMEDYFGKEIISTEVLTVNNQKFYKVYWDQDPDLHSIDEENLLMKSYTNTTPRTYMYEHASTSGWSALGAPGAGNKPYIESYEGTDDDAVETIYYSYVRLRSFNLARSTGLDGYRLMCCEFRNIYDDYNYDFSDLGDTHFYYLSIEVTDNTVDVIKDIIDSYVAYMESFYEDYLEIATDACGYNEVDGKFNQFFIDGMEEMYGSDYSTAPWIIMPIVYNMHKDLLYDEFGGSRDDLIESAKILSQKLSPFTGTLGEIERFYERIVTLFDTFYAGYDYDLSDIADGTAEPPELDIPALLYTLELDDADTNTRVYGQHCFQMGNAYDTGATPADAASKPDGDGDVEDPDCGAVITAEFFGEPMICARDIGDYLMEYIEDVLTPAVKEGYEAYVYSNPTSHFAGLGWEGTVSYLGGPTTAIDAYLIAGWADILAAWGRVAANPNVSDYYNHLKDNWDYITDDMERGAPLYLIIFQFFEWSPTGMSEFWGSGNALNYLLVYMFEAYDQGIEFWASSFDPDWNANVD